MNKNTKRKKSNIFLALSFFMLIAAIYLVLHQDLQQPKFATNVRSSLSLKSKSISEIKDTKYLWLINNKHGLSESYMPKVEAAFHVIDLAEESINIEEKTMQAAKKMFDDAKEQGYPSFFVSSGYRSFERQKEIYEEEQDKSYVQQAGYSEHQSGLAVDILYQGIGTKQMGNTKQGKWLSQNAWKYGFILRYPDGKKDKTNISYEPWHFRYVGLPHAYVCYKENLCFEEYIEYLKNVNGYRISLGGDRFYVYYAKPKHDIIELPKSGDYEISGDNTGGYIVTVRKQG